MARVLIVGCGCRGQELARTLRGDGHAVRGTTRSRDRFDAIRHAGAEPVLADPDRVGTLVPALEAVAIVVWLLGPATDPDLHTLRLRALFEKLVDTMVRGVVVETTQAGAAIAREAAATWAIPLEILDAAGDPVGAVSRLTYVGPA